MAQVLGGFPDFDVVGTATDLAQVFSLIQAERPDFVLLSYKFRGHSDSEVLMSLMQEEDIRWLELASKDPNKQMATSALSNASGLFEIDPTTSAPLLAEHIRSVCRNLRSPYSSDMQANVLRKRTHPLEGKTILIGASTGGVDCLMKLLEGYHSACPPTLIVQHTGSEFVSSLISVLAKKCPVPVGPARDGDTVRRGEVVMAGDGAKHLQLSGGHPSCCRSVDGPPVSGHRPSVDALFQSATHMARNIVAVLLTGMGRDGAAGMLALRKQGATTIAQDKASSVVYGMPRVAQELGAAQHVLGIAEIARVLTGAIAIPDSRGGPLG